MVKSLAASWLLFIATAAALQTCVVPSQYKCSKGKASDAAAISEVFARCSQDSIIEFSQGVDYNVFSPIKATNLSNVIISLKGNWNLPQNVTAIQQLVAAASGSLTWFTLGGKNVQILGTPNITTGWIKSYGQAWWDLNAPGGTGTANRPHLMSFSVTNGYIQHLKSLKPIAWNFSIKGSNITIEDTIIEATSNSAAFPFNTDGFDVGGTDITIRNSVIYNGDDAIAVGSGARNVLFQGGTIGYQTHGMSIGSLGSNQAQPADVSNIHFDDITVVNGVYGARFKSWIGGQGLAKNITWSNIRAYNVTFPIFVTQTYFNQATTGPPRPNNSSVNMQDFTWENFTGTINTFRPGDGSCVTDPCWYNVGLPSLAHTEAVIIECNTPTSCQNFALKNIELFPQNQTPPTQICINAMENLNPDLGIECRNGTFVPL
ncbi:family 28 glycosyl hydrolase [Coniochaeta sp. PMI_546]|nr:family 28 glycosyl hydrolase [Coniochaeta sp. PMI_546]